MDHRCSQMSYVGISHCVSCSLQWMCWYFYTSFIPFECPINMLIKLGSTAPWLSPLCSNFDRLTLTNGSFRCVSYPQYAGLWCRPHPFSSVLIQSLSLSVKSLRVSKILPPQMVDIAPDLFMLYTVFMSSPRLTVARSSPPSYTGTIYKLFFTFSLISAWFCAL